jgi:transposase InsO family protein
MIDQHKDRFGVEPICRVLEVPTSTYYARKRRPPSARAASDVALLAQIRQVHAANYGVYGARRVWKQLHRDGLGVARCTVERLMRADGLAGVRRGRKRRTTTPEPAASRPPDLVQRQFTATRPDQLWVADLTYVRTWEGWVYVAFVLDVFSRLLVGWQLASHLRTDLPLDALEMAIWRRQAELDGLVHHSDAGCQYTSFRYTSRLAELGVVPSIGSVADSFDNAMAESLIGTFKAELIDRQGWRTREEVEFAVVEWVAWYNNRRLHSSIGDIPPVELEANYYASTDTLQPTEPPNQASTKPGAAQDGLSAHWSYKMRTYLDAQRAWLTVERLPAYAPELNPVEFLWANLKGKGGELANFAGDTVAEVADQAHQGVQRVCDSDSLVVGFLAHTGLSLDNESSP